MDNTDLHRTTSRAIFQKHTDTNCRVFEQSKYPIESPLKLPGVQRAEESGGPSRCREETTLPESDDSKTSVFPWPMEGIDLVGSLRVMSKVGAYALGNYQHVDTIAKRTLFGSISFSFDLLVDTTGLHGTMKRAIFQVHTDTNC